MIQVSEERYAALVRVSEAAKAYTNTVKADALVSKARALGGKETPEQWIAANRRQMRVRMASYDELLSALAAMKEQSVEAAHV